MGPLLAALLAAAPGAWVARVADDTPLHLSVVLRLRDSEALALLIRDQRDPASPAYGHFLTPSAFGRRFGQPDDVIQSVADWLAAAGFSVEPSANQLFLGATGTTGQIGSLLGIELREIELPDRRARFPSGQPRIPDRFSGAVLAVDGLDTRPRFRPALRWTPMLSGMGPQDIRRFYGIEPLLQRGFVGHGQELVTLAIAESTLPDPAVVASFFHDVSNASLQYVQDVLPNPAMQFDDALGNEEFEFDPEAQSIAAPGATRTVQVVAPASEFYTAGFNEVVNNLPEATAVSISLTSCEETGSPAIAEAVRTLVQQGLAEGQTWIAASGDQGPLISCTGTEVAAASFPASIPEMLAIGGTEAPVLFDDAGAARAYVQETVWNSATGASGANESVLFQAPAWQLGAGVPDGGRRVPDLALIAGGGLSALLSSSLPGTLEAAEGTSLSAPFTAGIVALLADAVGCRLGLLQPTLYALGARQQDGGAAVFHDVIDGTTSFGTHAGVDAGIGFDFATGWGSLDVAELVDSWPACSPALARSDAGPRSPYDPCPACDGGGVCLPFFPEGPVWCGSGCGAGAPSGNCYLGCANCDFLDNVCQPYDTGPSLCVPSCFEDSDCAYLPGTRCLASGACGVATTATDDGGETGTVAAQASGCGCNTGTPPASLWLFVFGAAAIFGSLRRARTRRGL